MIKSKKLKWILTAAVSVTLVNSALAQYRVGTDGRALDANNRIGSGGINTDYRNPASVSTGNYMNNNLITGNVTGGKQFRGFVPYQSPDAFRGDTAGSLSDRFIRSSSAAPYGGIPQNNAQITQGFVGVSNAAPPPPGYVQQGFTGGAFVPGKAMDRSSGDLRLGQVLDTPTTALPQPGQFLMPGPIDPNSSISTVITGSPLYGVRQWNPTDYSDQQFLNNNMGRGGTNSLTNRMDPAALEQMRQELLSPAGLNRADADQNLIDRNNPNQNNNPDATQGNNNQGNNSQGINGQGNNNRQSLSGSVLTPIESPRNAPLGTSSVLQSNQTQSAEAFDGSLQTRTANRAKQATMVQSTQYAELQKRLGQYRQQDTDANGTPTSDRKTAAGERKKPAPTGLTITELNSRSPSPTPAAGATGAGSNSMTATTPGASANGSPRTAAVDTGRTGVLPSPISPTPTARGNAGPKPVPLQIKSLADGVQASGLAGLLKDAEEQMKQGKFNSALDKYDDADAVAPNNPLILMGKANALLGQSYYARAERNLREAFTKDQALLLGQYDLRSFLSADRLQFLVTELKSLAESEQKEPRHVFLLAYIAYNTGHEAQAAAYLTLAEKRAGGTDSLYPLIRKYWSLPTQNDTTDVLNK